MALIPAIPGSFAAIEEIENYAEQLCERYYSGDWDGEDCDIENAEDERQFNNDVAAMEDDICEDDEIYVQDEEDLCEGGDIYTGNYKDDDRADDNDKDEPAHSDKSYTDWEYDEEDKG